MDRDVLIYNGYDVINTLDAWDNSVHLMDEDYKYTYDFTMKLYEPLMFMMTRGVRVDFDQLNKVKEDVQDRTRQKQAELNELAGRELNANSPKQLREYFYVEKGIKPYTKRNAKGESSITLDDKALQRIARGTATRGGYPEAALIQEIRGLIKLYGTYLDINFDEDRRFRCSYNPRGTKFGRLSSSKTILETGMNMQNLPASVKHFLVADPGYLMWEIDKAKAEWVVVAYVSGDANMIKVIEEGLDPHIHTAYLMTDLPKELIAEEADLVGHTSDPNEIESLRRKLCDGSPANANAFNKAEFLPRTMSIRQCGKKSNHGLNYDEGFRTFALSNEMPEADAKRIIQLYKYKAYPGIPIWHKSVQDQLRHDRTLTNCFGRKYKFLGAWDTDLFKAAYAFIPQSTVADLVNKGIIDSYYAEAPTCLNQLEMLAQVHDSIMGQYPILTGDLGDMRLFAKALQTVGNYMDVEMTYGGRSFHIDNDLKVGDNWGKMYEVDISADLGTMSEQLMGVYNELRSGTKRLD